jgi:16S rRNA C1402 (ribose-2'-O) methylase RsmI
VIPARGEFVVLVAGLSGQQHESEAQIPVDLLLETLLAEQAPPSMIARVVARLSSRKRNEVYDELLKRGRANDA